jgi:hypothetical protein
MWLKFGRLPEQYDPDYYLQVCNEASSIYFVTLVVMQLFNLLATPYLQQGDAKLSAIPRHALRHRRRLHL